MNTKEQAQKVAELKTLLDGFLERISEEDLRPKVLALVDINDTLRILGTAMVDKSSARERILAYFRRYPFTVLHGKELEVVAGISEWARRIRELRKQFGWKIVSGETLSDMVADGGDTLLIADLTKLIGRDPTTVSKHEYVLLSEEQDRDAAYRWNLMNGIRRKKLGMREKMLEYLRKNVGKPVEGDELAYVANGGNSWPRRLRELRTEQGWPIVTRQQGRPDLAVGQYMLERDRQAPVHDRRIPDPVRLSVLQRDNFACRVCGWTVSDRDENDPRKCLELHHLEEHVRGGGNDEDNLLTLCNMHHDEVHAKRLSLSIFL